MKKVLVMLLALAMALSGFSWMPRVEVSADEDVIEVSDWSSLVTALESEGKATVKLTKDITKKIEAGASPWESRNNDYYKQYTFFNNDGKEERAYCGIIIRGEKVLDLNGKELYYDNCSNARTVYDCPSVKYALERSNSTFLVVPGGASLMVSDSRGGGKLNTDGYYIGMTNSGYGYYWDFYGGYANRDLIDVLNGGKLVVTGGELTAGGAKEQLLPGPVRKDNEMMLAANSYFAYQIISGKAVIVRKGGSFISYGGKYEGHESCTISVLAGAHVRFYDGNVQGECSAACFSCADDPNRDMKVYGGKFETFAHNRHRLLDRLRGYASHELNDTVMEATFKSAYAVLSPLIEHTIRTGYGYGRIGIPEEAMEPRNYKINQNNQKYYGSIYSGNTTVTPLNWVRLDIDADPELVNWMTIPYTKGHELSLVLYDNSNFIDGKKQVYEPDIPDEAFSLLPNASRQYLWEFMATENGKAEISYIGDRTLDFKTFYREHAEWFNEHPISYVRCTEKTEWKSSSKYKLENTSFVKMVKILEPCPHDWYVYLDFSTCSEAGERDWMCSLCGAMRKEDVPASGVHVPGKLFHEVDAETHAHHCIYCKTEIDYAEHEGPVISSEPMTEELTAEVHQCTACGYKWTEIVGDDNRQMTPYSFNFGEHWKVSTTSGITGDKGEHNFVYDNEQSVMVCQDCGYGLKPEYLAVDVQESSSYICPHEAVVMDISSFSAADQAKIQSHGYSSMDWLNVAGKPILSDSLSFKPTMEQYRNGLKWSADYNDDRVFFSLFMTDYESYESMLHWATPEYLVKVSGFEATCVSEGIKPHYVCTCGRRCDENMNLLSDADVIIPRTGHTYDNACDRFCNICNEEREAAHVPSNDYSTDETYHWHVCTVCGKALDTLAHTPETEDVKQVTCEADGQRVVKCSTCGLVLADEVIPHSEHIHTTSEVVDATCTADGKVTVKCDDCGKVVRTDIIPASGHAFVYAEEVPADCMNEGVTAHYECARCGKTFADDEGKQEVAAVAVAKDPSNHVGGEVLHDDKDHWTVCECGAILEKEAHVFENENPACAVCGYYEGEENPNGSGGNSGTSGSDDGGSGIGDKLVSLWWLWLLILLLLLAAAGTVYVLKKKKTPAEEPARGDQTPETAPAEEAALGEPEAATEEAAPVEEAAAAEEAAASEPETSTEEADKE